MNAIQNVVSKIEIFVPFLLGIIGSFVLIGSTAVIIMLGAGQRIESLNLFRALMLLGALLVPALIGGFLSLALKFS